MLGLDFSELLIIGVVALVVVGPKELPQLMRTIGQWVGKARRMASEFQGQMSEALREAELDDVKKHVDDLRSLSPKNLIAEQFSSVTRTFDEIKRDTGAQLAAIEAGVTTPSVAEAEAETVASVEAPAMAESEIAARIDAASPMPMDLGAPVFDPAPAVPADEAVAVASIEPKKERDA